MKIEWKKGYGEWYFLKFDDMSTNYIVTRCEQTRDYIIEYWSPGTKGFFTEMGRAKTFLKACDIAMVLARMGVRPE